jgi:hypothetical protein
MALSRMAIGVCFVGRAWPSFDHTFSNWLPHSDAQKARVFELITTAISNDSQWIWAQRRCLHWRGHCSNARLERVGQGSVAYWQLNDLTC